MAWHGTCHVPCDMALGGCALTPMSGLTRPAFWVKCPGDITPRLGSLVCANQLCFVAGIAAKHEKASKVRAAQQLPWKLRNDRWGCVLPYRFSACPLLGYRSPKKFWRCPRFYWPPATSAPSTATTSDAVGRAPGSHSRHLCRCFTQRMLMLRSTGFDSRNKASRFA
jgi:hypothetical protein